MKGNNVLARSCGLAGIVGIGIGILTGVLGLTNPGDIYAPPPEAYNYATQLGRIVAALHGIMVLGFTAAFHGYYLIGAAGWGVLGRTANALSIVGNLGAAIGFFHAALTGAASPITMLGFLILPGWLLLTVAALRTKQVSTLQALWPVITLVVLTVLEMAFPINWISAMLHQVVYGSISIVVLSRRSQMTPPAVPQPARSA
jgi:hypothetical protein